MSQVVVSLTREDGFKFRAENAQGKAAYLDGSKAIGGSEDGIRPMEMVLMGLGGCSSFDILSILNKQKQTVESFSVRVRGDRADAIPPVFTNIVVEFEAGGEVDPNKLEKACALSMEKYCSVAGMLNKTATISFTSKVI